MNNIERVLFLIVFGVQIGELIAIGLLVKMHLPEKVSGRK